MTLERWALTVSAALASALFWVAACSSPHSVPAEGGTDGSGSAEAGDAPDADSSDVKDAGKCATTDSPSEGGPDSGVPCLTALSVTATDGGGADAGVVLTPPFASNIHDYYVVCPDAMKNPLTVSMTASTGAESFLVQPAPPSKKKPSQTLEVSVDANQAIVAAATDGVATTEYWVRCLPSDFPAMAFTPNPEAGAPPPPGYYLIGWWFAPSGGAGYGMVLDSHGVPVWYTRPPNHYGVTDLDNVIPGTLSYTLFNGAPTGPFDLIQLRPYNASSVQPATDKATIHELQTLPNGHFLILADPVKYGVDLTGLTVNIGGVPTALGPGESIEDCMVVEFDSSGNQVWTWSASDHFDPAKDSTEPGSAFDGERPDGGGLLIDTFHCNSIDVDKTSPDPNKPNLLISSRHMDSIFYIERASGRVVWKMGGARASKDDAIYVTPSTSFYLQHDARLQPGWVSTCNGGSGKISLFDDETGHGSHARGLLFDVSVGVTADGGAGDAGCPGEGGTPDAGDGAAGEGGTGLTGTAKLASSFSTSIASSLLAGSFRILPDGSHVVGWGLSETGGAVFTEFDDKGKDLLDFSFPSGGRSYRAIKVPLGQLNLNDLRNTAGLPPPP